MPLEPGAVAPDPAILHFLAASGLVARTAPPVFTPLRGGVSSDIWLVRAANQVACVKRARAQLKVATPWHAPITRNAAEAAWLTTVAGILPGAVPRVLAADAEAGIFAMDYLPPETYPVWKAELRRGNVDLAFAATVGARLARIHAAMAWSPAAAAQFATDETFHAIRLEPYFLAAASAHPDLAPMLEALVRRTAATRVTLVHGDVSPKNILIGPEGPVFIDAECAWFGDPAFDLGFCLNHLLLKCLWVPGASPRLLAAFDALAAAYLGAVDWEHKHTIEARAATLLPGLLIARIDGKSPVEYVTAAADKALVRRVAAALLCAPPVGLAGVRAVWAAELGA